LLSGQFNKLNLHYKKYGIGRKILPWRIIFVLVVLFQGCGFHLRGSANLPASMAETYVQDRRPPTDIALPLRRALSRNGVKLVSSPDKASAVLQLDAERFDRRLLSTSAGSRIKDYELQYQVVFSVQKPDGTALLASQTVNVTRELTFDESQVLAKTSEQDELHKTMVEDAARQILRRLQALNH
jgi:LPS-assembly lipoprotein